MDRVLECAWQTCQHNNVLTPVFFKPLGDVVNPRISIRNCYLIRINFHFKCYFWQNLSPVKNCIWPRIMPVNTMILPRSKTKNTKENSVLVQSVFYKKFTIYYLTHVLRSTGVEKLLHWHVCHMHSRTLSRKTTISGIVFEIFEIVAQASQTILFLKTLY